MREYSGRHEYDGVVKDLSPGGVRAALGRLAGAVSAATVPDGYDEAQLAAFIRHTQVQYGELELHRRNPLYHLGGRRSGLLRPAGSRQANNVTGARTWPGGAGSMNSATEVEMMPGQTVNVGSRVSFRITSKKPGYLVLVDVDATGHLTQIYPNTASLIRANNPKGNYVKPGSKLMIPLAADPYAGGVEYVVSPPSGQAMIVAILSAQPVQILDLPDVPPEVKDQSDRLAWLAKWTRELRIPDDATNQLREAQWSFNAKPYIIQ